jgi:hypothetical protein
MQLIRREEAATWFAAWRDQTADYRTNLQKKLAVIERNMDEPNKEASPPCWKLFTNAKPPSSKRTRKNERQLLETRSVPSVAASIEA